MLNPKIISENIIFLRQQQNMTQQELADRVNVTHQAVSKWENGSSIPDLQTLMTLSRLFNVTLDELLTEVLSERRAAPEASAPADQPAAESSYEPDAKPSENTAPPIDIAALARTAPFSLSRPVKQATSGIAAASMRVAAPLAVDAACVDCHDTHLAAKSPSYLVDELRAGEGGRVD